MSRLRVMVVNDEPVQLAQIAGVLHGAGYEVSSFERPVEALEALAAGASVSLFVVDLHMPGIDGWKLCRLLRSPEFGEFNHTPVLVVSATFAGDDVEALTRALGADGFMEAPFQAQDLLEAAATLLAGGVAGRIPTALIVEDDAALRQVLARTFAAHGYRVLEQGTVEGAQGTWSAFHPDVVLLDHHLPDGTSVELLDELADIRERTSVLIMTGDTDPFLPVRLFARGADGYLRKPFDPADAVEQARSTGRQRALLRIGSLLQSRHEQQQASERRLHQSRRLESLGLLAGGIAHEFNNLLVGILGNADLAAMDVPEGSPAHASLDQVVRLARRAAERTRQILAFTGKTRLLSDDVDLGMVVAQVVREMPSPLAARVRVLERPAAPRVRGDAERLNEVIRSLVMNGIEAIPPGRGEVTVAVAARDIAASEALPVEGGCEAAPGRYVAVEVTDDGSGMDEVTRSKMFDPFFSTKFMGRGLGLAAVLGIVRAHGGSIAVRTAPGAGTAVTVLLPALAGA